MKIFITGGTGFIGRRLVEKLAKDQNNQIICLTRNISKVPIPAFNNVEYVEGDITKPETYEKFLKGIDVVYHLAAFVKYGVSKKEAKTMRKANIDGTKELFNICQKLKISKVVYLSTAMIYHPTGDVLVTEKTAVSKKQYTSYSETKQCAFLLAKKFMEDGLPITIILPTSVYGANSPLFYDFANFIKKYKVFFGALVNKKISLVFVDDVVSGTILASNQKFNGESFILSAEIIDVGYLISLLERKLKTKVRLINTPIFFAGLVSRFFTIVFGLLGATTYINKEIFDFINGNFTASGDKAKKELHWVATPLKEREGEIFGAIL